MNDKGARHSRELTENGGPSNQGRSSVATRPGPSTAGPPSPVSPLPATPRSASHRRSARSTDPASPASTRAAAQAREVAGAVPDPEIPVLTIEDLGILRDVEVADDGHVQVTITPTYSGCPAMDAIRDDVVAALAAEGYDDVTVELVLSPAWTTDWMSNEGRRKLEEYGIAPPTSRGEPGGPVALTLSLRCPRCGSPDTRELSRFGSTACKSLWVCNTCREPFDHFKSI